MIDEYIHPWDSPANHADADLPKVSSTPTQLLSGVPIGSSSPETQCIECRGALREGDRVVVYAYRAAEAALWDVVRWYCPDCGSDGINVPTLGTNELIVTAVLGTVSDVRRQTHQSCLLDVEPVAVSPPTEGTPL